MDEPQMVTIVELAEYMSAEAIVARYADRFDIQIVKNGLYPVGIQIHNTIMYIAALQPQEEEIL